MSGDTAKPRHRRSGFAGDVAKLASGTAAAQLLVVAAAPILSRLFSPADFGTAAIFAAFSGILIAIACLSYESAVLLPDDDDEAASIVGVASIAALIMAAMCALVATVFHEPIEHALHWARLPGWPWLLAAATFLGGMSAALSAWHTRQRQFGRISFARVSGSVVGTSLQLGAGALGRTTPAGLVYGSVSSIGVSAVVLGLQLGRHDARRLLRAQRVTRMWESAVRYRKFPLLSSWSTLLNTLSWQLPALLLGYFFDSTIVGYYALGFRMLQLPMGLVGSSIAQVFFQRAARAKNEGQLALVVRGVYDVMLDVGLLPMAILGIAGPEIFTTILGAPWHEAGVYAQMLSAWTLVWFISSPLHTLFAVLERQGLGLFMDMLIFVSRFASLAVGGWLGSPRLAIALFSATGVLVYGYVALVAMSKSGVQTRAVLAWTARKALGIIPACLVLLLLGYLHVSAWVIVVVAAVFILTKWSFILFQYRAGQLALLNPSER